MTHEQKLELIKSYIDDIRTYEHDEHLSTNERQHIKRALDVYTNLYSDVEKGKVDADLLHENITSFLYMLQ